MKTPHKYGTTFKRTSWLALLATFLGASYLLAAPTGAPESAPPKKTNSSEGFAVWYRVPPNSLARRRAKPTEFTAAHNRLPLGTLVRVTRISNGQSVLVRITDRGITNRRANIDICKEAAEQLGMIREGFSRVLMEIIPDPVAAAAPDPNQVAAH